jgi:hypothetical protein
LGVFPASFGSGKEVVALLAAESLVERGGPKDQVNLAVQDERGTRDQRGVAFVGVGGDGAEESGGAVCSVGPRAPPEERGGLGSTGSLTEVDASTGALVRVVYGARYRFDAPDAMVMHGDDLFVANKGGVLPNDEGSLTEVDASTGAPVRVLTGATYQFDQPEAMVMEGDDLFVANGGNTSLTEVDASTGALVRVVSGPAYMFNGPDAMVRDGADLWVANEDGSSLTELPA